MKIAESELIINPDGSCFHLHLKPEELAGNIILVGDPGRVDMIAKYLTDIELTRQSREFNTVTGHYKGKRITVLSTGIGVGNCDIVMNELDALANIDFATREIKENKTSLNILRIGTTGAIQPEIPLGSFIFSEVSVGMDGLVNWYADRDRMNIQDAQDAFLSQVGWDRNLPVPYFVRAGEDMSARFEGCAIKGMTISAIGFYGPQGRVLRMGLAMPDMIEQFEKFSWKGLKITNFEMESSVIGGIGRLLGHNCGTICCVVAQRYTQEANPDYKGRMEELVQLSLDKFV